MPTARSVLKSVFGLPSFRRPQEEVIANLLAGRNTLCLMPTGAGKSICYQVAGLLTGKTTLVLSPLRVLASQHAAILRQQGLQAMTVDGGLPTKEQFKLLRQCLHQAPQFLFFSVERASHDGYLEYILRQLRESIGLVTVDEAHCVSQWGHNFRPAYKGIPEFLDRIFLQAQRPPVLCLTATLSARDRQEICHDFSIAPGDVLQSKTLYRDNLVLSRETRANEADKLVRLEEILSKHKRQKTLVYVHRKKGHYGTSALRDLFHAKGFNCDYFDADLDNQARDRALNGFLEGSIHIMFATGAFGMGVHIPDIRVVIHYLLPESIEQYYQEVGRGGRDGKPAHCYLLFTDTNARVRRDLIKAGFPTAEQLTAFHDGLPFDGHGIADLDPINGLPDEDLLCYHLLKGAGIFSVACRGLARISDFQPTSSLPAFDQFRSLTRLGLAIPVSRMANVSLNSLMDQLFTWYSAEELKLATSPIKMLFLQRRAALTEAITQSLTTALEVKKTCRLENANKLIDLISSNAPLAKGIRDHLAI
jgi:ATP-dependent DNA helicase RecQ